MGQSLQVRTTFIPTSEAYLGSRSAVASLLVPGLPGLPLRWYASLLVFLSCCILLTLLFRYRRVLLVLISPTRRNGSRRPLHRAGDQRDTPLVAGELSDAQKRVTWLSGIIQEHGGPQVARFAEVRLLAVGQSTPKMVYADSEGAFEIGGLDHGAYTLELAAPKFLKRTAHVQIPHDGSLDGCIFVMSSVRGVLRDVLMTALRPITSALTWGRDTPREIADALSSSEHQRAEELQELAALVEDAWFTEDGVPSEALEQADTLLRPSAEERQT